MASRTLSRLFNHSADILPDVSHFLHNLSLNYLDQPIIDHSSSHSLLTLVAEESSPALLTVALPGLLAGPVEAAGVSGALVAALALPALPAHTLPGRAAETVLLAAPRGTDG